MKKMLFLSLVVALFSENVWADCTEGHQCWSCGSSSSACYADFNPETGHLEITGNGKMTSRPWSGVSVTSVDISGVTSIADSAFGNGYTATLQEVRISDSVKSIGSYAFHGSTIKTLVIPDSVTSIGSYAFWEGKIGRVYCPSHLDCLTNQWSGDMISYDKVGETYQIDGKTYDTIEEMKNSFCPEGHQCWSCGSISANCKADLNLETGHLEIVGKGAMTSHGWCSVKNSITSVNISGVTSIAGSAFGNGCGTTLQEVNISDSVTSIGPYAFHGSQIQTLVIPDSVTSIGSYAFWEGTIRKVYCPSHLDCSTNQWPRSRTSYEKVGDYYSMGGKMYHDLDHMLKGIEMKRIYTVSEAEDALGKNNKNTFSIRYR